MPTAYIALGANIGDRKKHLEDAHWALNCLPASRLVSFSKIYETDPVGPSGPDRFLNAAAELLTSLAPLPRLPHLLAIEKAAGRLRHERWAPRTLDLDLLMFDDRVMHHENLTLPHPRMHERRFVLQPLCDIAPKAVHPVMRVTIRELLEKLPTMAG